MLDKLPGALGKEIADRFQNDISDYKGTYIDHIGTRVWYIFRILKEKCTTIQITKQLKGEYDFYKEIFVPQQYGRKQYKNNNYRKRGPPRGRAPTTIETRARKPRRYGKTYRNNYYNPRNYNALKGYYTRRSNKRGKLNYDPNKHVRKFNKERTYTNELSCFTCGGL